MIITPMSPEECRDLLARVSFGRLACAKNNQPYVVPTYFACHDGNIYGFSLAGQKIDWMRANPRVCLEADEVKDEFHWQTVIATGHYEELTDDPKFSAERALAHSLLQQRYMAWQMPYEIFQQRKAGRLTQRQSVAILIAWTAGTG